MPSKIGRTTEREISLLILRIAAEKPGHYVTLDELRAEIPLYMDLTPADLEYSTTRPGERMWEQSLRNVQSLHANSTSFIRQGLLDHIQGGGYAATDAGREFLRALEQDQAVPWEWAGLVT